MVQWADLTQLYDVFSRIGRERRDLEQAIAAVRAVHDAITEETSP